MNDIREIIENLISEFQFDKKTTKKERAAVTVFIHPEEKLAYDILQARTQKTFSRLVSSIVRETIRKAAELAPQTNQANNS